MAEAKKPTIDFQPIDFQPLEEGGGIQFEEDAPTMKERILKAAGGGARGLDYAGGAVRGTLGRLTGAITPEEYKAGLAWGSGQAMPDGAEILKRWGVPEGTRASDSSLLGGLFEDRDATGYAGAPGKDTWWPDKGGWLDVTERGAGGFALDMITDPLNWISGGSAGLAKKGAVKKIAAEATTKAGKFKAFPRKAGGAIMDKLLIPAELATQLGDKIPLVGKAARAAATFPSGLARAAGNKLYNRGLAPLIELGDKRGKDIADTFYRYGVQSVGDLGEGLRSRADGLKTIRDKILSKADEAGATVSREAAFDGLFQRLKTLVDQRRITREQADKLLTEFSDVYAQGGDPSTTLATLWKTDVRKGVPASAWNELKTSSPHLSDQLAQDVGSGLQHGVEDAVGKKIGAQESQRLAQANSDLGDFLTVADKARSMSYKSQPPLTPIDWLILSGEMMVPGNQSLGVFAGKKAYDALISRPGALRTGYHLKKAADNRVVGPLLDAAVRRKITDKIRPPKKENENE